jgi:hypothetical protein
MLVIQASSTKKIKTSEKLLIGCGSDSAQADEQAYRTSKLDTVQSQQETPTGTSRINIFATTVREILATPMLETLRRFPAIGINLNTKRNLVDIAANCFDFGVPHETPVQTDMISIRPPTLKSQSTSPGISVSHHSHSIVPGGFDV